MKKAIALLAGLTMLVSMGMAGLAAGAAPVQPAPEDYDYYELKTTYHLDENGEKVPVHTDVYCKFNEDGSGESCAYSRKYNYVFLTVDDSVDTELLSSILDERIETIYYHTIADNQLVYKYSPDVEYESLYDISGVEKVELTRYVDKSPCRKEIQFYDTWAEDNGIDKYNNNLLESIVLTEPNLEVTPELFADTGFTVEHVYQHEPGKWSVYFDYTSVGTYTDFDEEAEKIDGVISSQYGMTIFLESCPSLAFTTVEKAAEPSTEEPTEQTPAYTVVISPDYVKGEYDCHFVEDNGKRIQDVYLIFNPESPDFRKIFEVDREYLYALVTAENAGMDAVYAILGEESDTDMQTTGENEYLFPYSADVDYQSLYVIPGVEKVELLRTACRNNFYSGDFGEMIESNLMVYGVSVDSGVDLPQVLADADISIESANEETPGYWRVYVDHYKHPELKELCADMEKLDGISKVNVYLSMTELYTEIPIPYLVLDPSAEPPVEEPTEDPTDAQLPTEEPTADVPATEPPTAAENPTEAPTEKPTEKPTEPSTEKSTEKTAVTTGGAQNPKTGMPWGGAVQGLAAALAVGSGALALRSRKKEE